MNDSMAASTFHTQCCIVGGGPAGMMLGYLLARAGIDCAVLEKHADFFRDFRGDTVHPSTMAVMAELGILDEFLKVPHQRVERMDGVFGNTRVRIADMTRLDTPCPFVAFMPQWDFLNFLEQQGRRYPKLKVLKKTEAVDLVREGDRVTGVTAKTPDGMLTIIANLTVGCDGRHSTVRQRAGLDVENIGAPIDVMWFRVSKEQDDSDVFARIKSGQMMVTINRGDYWQCAYVIAKGGFERVKEQGLDAFRAHIAELAPVLAAHVGDVMSWDDVKLLTVAIDRLRQWALPGLLCIGDAAHAMSPVGGVGINLAIQDAVATANVLWDKFGEGTPSLEALNAVQARRTFPVRMTQAMQVTVQNRLIDKALTSRDIAPPLAIKLVSASPWLQGLTARMVGIGVRPEHVHSPERAV